MIIKKQFSYKNRDITFSLFDSLCSFGDIALPLNISWSKIGGLFGITFRFIIIALHIEIWNNKGDE